MKDRETQTPIQIPPLVMFLPIPESVRYCHVGTQTKDPSNTASLLDTSLDTAIEYGLDTPMSADPVQSVPTIHPNLSLTWIAPKIDSSDFSEDVNWINFYESLGTSVTFNDLTISPNGSLRQKTVIFKL